MNYAAVAADLLKWYDKECRALPWRETKDPYYIWVSEVMLQQTRVETVIPYYRRFIDSFPDMETLAAAPSESVLAHWQGLGYYSRVRNLQQGVREVVAHYGGKVPETRSEVEKLPGVGSYTAGAILSIAYDKPEPAVDGNVLRVISRLEKIESPVEQTTTRKQVEEAVRLILTRAERPGDVTQALMELGALICIPRAPRCENCPWQVYCQALGHKLQTVLPNKKTPVAAATVWVYTGLVHWKDRFLVVQRPARGLLAGMWEFPSIEFKQAVEPVDFPVALQQRLHELGQDVEIGVEWRYLIHTFSHREWKLRAFFCIGNQYEEKTPAGAKWVASRQFGELNWAGPYRKLAIWAADLDLPSQQEKGK